LWWLRTRHRSVWLLQDEVFQNVSDLRLRADRVEVVASNGDDGPAEHATLVVDSVNKSGGEVKVSLLARYERAKQRPASQSVSQAKPESSRRKPRSWRRRWRISSTSSLLHRTTRYAGHPLGIWGGANRPRRWQP
jgi:hypothetical protein